MISRLLKKAAHVLRVRLRAALGRFTFLRQHYIRDFPYSISMCTYVDIKCEKPDWMDAGARNWVGRQGNTQSHIRQALSRTAITTLQCQHVLRLSDRSIIFTLSHACMVLSGPGHRQDDCVSEARAYLAAAVIRGESCTHSHTLWDAYAYLGSYPAKCMNLPRNIS